MHNTVIFQPLTAIEFGLDHFEFKCPFCKRLVAVGDCLVQATIPDNRHFFLSKECRHHCDGRLFNFPHVFMSADDAQERILEIRELQGKGLLRLNLLPSHYFFPPAERN